MLLRDDRDVVWAPIGDLYYGSGGSQICIHDGQRVRKIRPARQVCEAPLATITCNRIDLNALTRLPIPPTPEARRAWSMLTGRAIRQAMVKPLPRKCQKVSRKLSKQDIQHLQEWGVFSVSGRVDLVHPVFKVPKATESRLIMDCRALNELLPKPGNMGLESLHSILDGMLRGNYMAQVDGKSYFYQFPLDLDAQKLFGAQLGAQRGAFIQMMMAVLPMGFSFAPFISQQTSNHLIRNVDLRDSFGAAWVDNFLFSADSEQECWRVLNDFLAVCKKVNVEIKEAQPTVTTRMQALGIIIDSQEKSISVSEEMATSLQEAYENWNSTPTPRRFYAWAGTVLWVAYAVMRIPLCWLEPLLAHMSEIGKDRAPNKWDEHYEPGEDLRRVAREWTDKSKEAQWIRGETSPTVGSFWSDASDSGMGLIVEGQEELWWMAEPLKEAPIYVAELLMAAVGLMRQDARGHRTTMKVDNSAAVSTLLRGHSSSKAGNLIMRKLTAATQLDGHQVVWVPSEAQRADALSRGEWSGESKIAYVTPRGSTVRWSTRGLALREEKKGGGDVKIHSCQPPTK